MIDIANFIPPAITSTLSAFGAEAKEEKRFKEEFHTLTKDINVIVGIIGIHRGIITFEVDTSIAESIFSLMAPGMKFDLNDPFSISAISEMANMVSGAILSTINHPELDITPPTAIIGEDIQAVINTENAEKILFKISNGELIVGFSVS